MIHREQVADESEYHVLQVFYKPLVRNAGRSGVALQLPINSRNVEMLLCSFFAREISRYVEAARVFVEICNVHRRERRGHSRFHQLEIRILISMMRVLTRRDALEAGSMSSSSVVDDSSETRHKRASAMRFYFAI